MKQKTALRQLIEYTDSMVKPGHLHNESLLKIIDKAKSLLPTEMEHINQAFKDGT